MLLTEWNAMKQVAQISTHDLAFNDIRKTSCCLQSSHFNKLTDIHRLREYHHKHTHTHTHLHTMYLFGGWILRGGRMQQAIWVCIRHDYVQRPKVKQVLASFGLTLLCFA